MIREKKNRELRLQTAAIPPVMANPTTRNASLGAATSFSAMVDRSVIGFGWPSFSRVAHFLRFPCLRDNKSKCRRSEGRGSESEQVAASLRNQAHKPVEHNEDALHAPR